VAAYFDRLVRSLTVQAEIVQRVERAGGKVLAVDVGQVTEGTASQWLSGTMHGMVAEYYARAAGERTAAAQARAVARGVLPWPNITPGYLIGEDGVLSPDPTTAPIVTEAFRMRGEGAPIAEVRRYLTANGIDRSYHGVQSLLRSPRCPRRNPFRRHEAQARQPRST
jgi:DNA invertase Pin-like site-specific DNA recombinase